MSNDYIVDVPSKEALVEANEEVKLKINAFCSDFNDILSNISTLEYDITLIDSSVAAGISDFPKLDISGIKTEVNNISKIISTDVLKIFGILPKYEEVIDRIDLGEPYDKGMFEFNIEWQDFAGWGTDVLDELSEKNQIFGAIGFLVNYAINDPAEQTVDNIFGDDMSDKISDAVWGVIRGHIKNSTLANSTIPLWINAPVGGIVASFGVLLVDLITHEGSWDYLDTERLLWDMASAFGSTVTSTLVAAGISAVCTKIGGAIGSAAGPIGAFVGAIAGWGIGLLVDWVGSEATGDVQIDKYIVKWNEDGTSEILTWTESLEESLKNGTDSYRIYEVPRNGNGDHGTYDDLVLRYDSYQKHNVYGSYYSEKNYQNYMYGHNWNDFIHDGGSPSGDLYENSFNILLDDIMKQEFHNPNEVWDWINENYYTYVVDDYEKAEATYMLEYLAVTYGFDPWEYYVYRKDHPDAEELPLKRKPNWHDELYEGIYYDDQFIEEDFDRVVNEMLSMDFSNEGEIWDWINEKFSSDYAGAWAFVLAVEEGHFQIWEYYSNNR